MARPASKDKTLQDKLKQFFGLTKGTSHQPLPMIPKIEEVVIKADVFKDIGESSPIAHRLKAIRELHDIVQARNLQEGTIETLCSHTMDMLHPLQTAEVRHTILSLYCCLIRSQFSKLTIMRDYFFRVIKGHNLPEDLVPRLEMLKALSDDGRKIEHFEEEAGPFLLEWLPSIITGNKAQEFLPILINMIKYNAAYLDENVISGIVLQTCNLCVITNNDEDVNLCLQVLDAVICYSYPPHIVPYFVTTLSRTVNAPKFCQLSWKVMRNLLGTCLGHFCIYTLCTLLQDSNNVDDPFLLRGATFFVSMALWSCRRVPSLENTTYAVLPCILKALDCSEAIVSFEVMLGLQRLLRHVSEELTLVTWDLVLDIINKLMTHPHMQLTSPPSELFVGVHDLISSIEQLHGEGIYQGSIHRLFEIVENAPQRPEASVLRLIVYKTQFLHSSRTNWLNDIIQLMEKYFKNDKRSVIRAKVLDVLSNVFSTNRYLYEDELIDNVVLPYFSHIELDPDISIRMAVIKLLVNIIEDCTSKKCLDLLDIMEKVMRRAFEQFHYVGAKDVSDTVHIISEEEVADVKTAIIGLVKIFKKKLHLLPSLHAVHIYKMLVNHIHSHYSSSVVIEKTSVIRHLILEFLLKLRANSLKQLGIANGNKTEFSAYLLCTLRNSPADSSTDSVSSPTSTTFPPCTVTYLDLSEAFQIIITCLKHEKDWLVLDLVLQELPKLLQSKAAVIAGLNSVNALCSALCAMITDRRLCLPEALRNTPSRLTRTDFQSSILPVLAALAAYHNEMACHVQRMMVSCLHSALVTKCARNSITVLIQCTLEMQDTMCKLLPGLLLSLSKISATICISIPVLEFLSILIRLPQLYVNFVEDQYMSIFAIAIPYTHPKFDQYTAALAHRVIAMWFLKCRIPFRRDFARFITKSLRATMFPSAENSSGMFQGTNSDDAITERKRSGSGSTNSQTDSSDIQASTESTKPLITHLLETCMDLMARFTFGMCSNHPKRSVVADFLLENGQKASWLVGNKIITITTSGCGTKAFKNGLCEKCYALCKNKSDDQSENDKTASVIEQQSTRRRHRSAVHRSTSIEISPSFSRTKDDLQLHRQSSDGRLTEALGSGSELKCSSAKVSNISPLKSFEVSSPLKTKSAVEEVTPADSMASTPKNTQKSNGNLCSCWCNGWAEIFIRRPTGNTSWMLRIQNRLFLPNCPPDLTLPDVMSLILPNKVEKHSECFPAEHENFEDQFGFEHLDTTIMDPLEDIAEQVTSTASELDTDQSDSSDIQGSVPHARSNSPLRRTNSSPEMKGEWNTPTSVSKPTSESSSSPPFEELITSVQDIEERITESRQEIITKSGDILPNDQQSRSSVCKSSKDDKLTCFSEECVQKIYNSSLKEETRQKLHLDLSNVGGSILLENKSSASPPLPHSASPQLIGRKTRSPPMSPRGRITGPRSPPPVNYYRDRGHTISVMSPVHGKKFVPSSKVASSYREMYRSGLSPSFVFLQLYHSATFGTSSEKPVLLPKSEVIDRAIRMIDQIAAYETHKIGVVYVGPGQANQESVIFANECGSVRYTEFLNGLGTVVRMSEVDPRKVYLGGMDGNSDGKFAYIWHDDMIQVVFHVATMMPNKEQDPSGNNKKLHIANDFVTIVYNESGEDYDMGTIKSQFTSACVIICPEDFAHNVVTVKLKPEISAFEHAEPHIVSDESLPIFVRQLAVHANLISMMIIQKQRNSNAYFSTWLERLKKIKQLRIKARQEAAGTEEGYVDCGNTEHAHHLEDFTDYV